MHYDLSIEPVEINNTRHTIIRVMIHYDKKATGPVLVAQAANVDDGFYKYGIFTSPKHSEPWETGWKVNSKKKLEQCWEQIHKDLKGRTGRVWDVVQDFAAKNGLTLIHKRTL